MGFWPFQGKNNHTVHVNSYFNLDEFEYAFEFSDDEGILLERAYDNQQRGGGRRVPRPKADRGFGIERSAELPERDEVHRPGRTATQWSMSGKAVQRLKSGI